MIYMVCYDLSKRDGRRNYPQLYELFDKFSAQQVLRSQWVLASNDISDAEELEGVFRKFIGNSDRLFVVSLDTGDWAGWNLKFDINKL